MATQTEAKRKREDEVVDQVVDELAKQYGPVIVVHRPDRDENSPYAKVGITVDAVAEFATITIGIEVGQAIYDFHQYAEKVRQAEIFWETPVDERNHLDLPLFLDAEPTTTLPDALASRYLTPRGKMQGVSKKIKGQIPKNRQKPVPQDAPQISKFVLAIDADGDEYTQARAMPVADFQPAFLQGVKKFVDELSDGDGPDEVYVLLPGSPISKL